MDPERWREIDAVFTLALEREGDHRGTFLDEACRGDDELRTEVNDLLASAKAAEDYFGGLVKGIGPPTHRPSRT